MEDLEKCDVEWIKLSPECEKWRPFVKAAASARLAHRAKKVMQMTVFLFATLLRALYRCQRFGRPYWLHLQLAQSPWATVKMEGAGYISLHGAGRGMQ